MTIVKKIFSFIFAFIFTIAVLFLSATFFAKELITRDNIYNALEESDIMKEAMQNNSILISIAIPDELLDYIEIDDLIYGYIADLTLYELEINDEVPTIDLIELNDRVVEGLDKYVDEKLDSMTGGLSSYFDLTEIKNQIIAYLEQNTDLDLRNAQILSESDLQKIYEYSTSSIDEIKDSTYLFELAIMFFSEEAQIIALVVIIISFILIALINFNIVTALIYTTASFAISAITYFIVYIVSQNLNFDGRLGAKIINIFMDKIGDISIKYILIFLVLTFFTAILFYLGKKINIFINHKKGITTLDTVFDDYDREEVLKEMHEEKKQEKQ